MERLPKVLEREPLIEAVFEIRFTQGEFSEVLPGALFNALDPKPQLRRLPMADIPRPLRAADPNLAYAPTMHLLWEGYTIMVGDRNFAVACGVPYPKWPNFKRNILFLLDEVAKLGLDTQIERFSIKYINLIQGASLGKQFKSLKLALSLGGVEIANEQLQLRLERKEGDLIHVISILIGASGTGPGGAEVHGAVVDIDSIHPLSPTDAGAFLADIEKKLEILRQENKRKFFGCLTPETIESMGPVYE